MTTRVAIQNVKEDIKFNEATIKWHQQQLTRNKVILASIEAGRKCLAKQITKPG